MFFLVKALKIQKTIKGQGKKQVEDLKFLKPNSQQLIITDAIRKNHLNEETKDKKEKNK